MTTGRWEVLFMLLLYITYIDFGEFRSGSSVRPQMMYQAFEDLGWEVKLLQTQQNKRAQRKAAVEEINHLSLIHI